jgi:hypothetical protein
MTKMRLASLSEFWLDELSESMEKHYPQIVGEGKLVDHWKIDGYNCGTTTLFGVYSIGTTYYQCTFPDYRAPTKKEVTPKFEHTGWAEENTRGELQ